MLAKQETFITILSIEKLPVLSFSK
jgi:hypothetical protein